MKHTPTPYRVEFAEFGGYDCMTSAYRIRYDTLLGEAIADLDTGNRKNQEDEKTKANAQFIVTSCNAVGLCEEKGLIDLEKLRENPQALAELLELVSNLSNYAYNAEVIQQSLSKLK